MLLGATLLSKGGYAARQRDECAADVHAIMLPCVFVACFVIRLSGLNKARKLSVAEIE